jgi:hypothetical protein
MEATTAISPSAEARQVYNMMVVRARPCGGALHLSLARSIELSVTLGRMGEDSMASSAVAELQDADWIAPASHGGWKLA